MSPASVTPGRRSISLASASASSGVRSGERFGPIFTRPPNAHQLVSISMQTRTRQVGPVLELGPVGARDLLALADEPQPRRARHGGPQCDAVIERALGAHGQ